MSSTATITGRCLCGAVTYSFTGEPALQFICHCDDCQRAQAGPFVAGVGVPRKSLTVEGESSLRSFTTVGEDTGQERERFFCATCGSPVYGIVAEVSHLVFLKIGTLDDRSVVAPQVELWTQSAQPWLDLGGGDERTVYSRGFE